MAKATIQTNLRFDPELYEAVMLQKGPMTLRYLLEQLLTAWLEGRVKVEEEGR